MTKKAWIGIGLVAVIAVILVTVVTQRGSTKKIRIGVVGPFTGEGATYGQSMKRGYELALADEDDIELVYEDDRLSAKDGVAAINKLISADRIKAFLGSAASNVTLAMAPIAERNKVVLFSSISTSDDLKNSGAYFFRNVPRNEVQGTTAADFLYNRLHKHNVAILKKNDEYGTNLAQGFKDKFQQLGGQVLLDEAYQPKTRDFKSTLAKIKSLNPQAYIPHISLPLSLNFLAPTTQRPYCLDGSPSSVRTRHCTRVNSVTRTSVDCRPRVNV